MFQAANIRCNSSLVLPAIIVAMLLCVSGTVQAQGGGQQIPGGGFDPNQIPTQQPVQDQPVDDGGTGDTDGNANDSDGQLEEVEPLRLEREIPDRRNQGFVGPTAPYIDENGFVGPPRGEPDNAEDGLAENRFRGGEINAGLGNRTATTTSAELQENGFTVQRRSLRTKLRPAFAAPRTPAIVTESRFQSRITRQPVVRNFGAGVTITVSNRTAVMTGVVQSAAEKQIIVRQLRLEPGVYKIDDQTTISR